MSIVISKEALRTASPKTKRAVRREYELEHVALDCVFAANNTREFRLMLESTVMQDKRYEALPLYRQVAIDAYIRGALDALSHQAGLPLSEAPDSVQPKARHSLPPSVPARPKRRASVLDMGTSYSNIWAGSLAAAARKPSDS